MTRRDLDGGMFDPAALVRAGTISRRDANGQAPLFTGDDAAALDALAAQASDADHDALGALA